MKVAELVKKASQLKDWVADRVFRLKGEGAFEVLAKAQKLEKQGR